MGKGGEFGEGRREIFSERNCLREILWYNVAWPLRVGRSVTETCFGRGKMPPRKKNVEIGVSLKNIGVDLTPDMAKAIVGWKEVEKSRDALKVDGPQGRIYVELQNNKNNRNFKIRLAERYGRMMLRGEWAGQVNSPSKTGNGESMTLDQKGGVISAAHRCVGLILADMDRQKLEASGEEGARKLRELGLKPGKPIVLPNVVVVKDVHDPAADTADTGKGRSLGDVLFRRRIFRDGAKVPESVQARLSRELANAVRLVSLRMGGAKVSTGGKLEYPTAVKFLEKNPLLQDCIEHIWEENGGGGRAGNRIAGYIGLGQAAGLMYLQAYSASDRAKYEAGELDMARKPKNWAAAEKFWTLFSAFAVQEVAAAEAPPIAALYKALEANRRSEDKLSRDAMCVLVARAWLAWMGVEESKWRTIKSLQTKLYAKDGEKMVLAFERFGGFDLDKAILEEKGWLEPDEEEVEITSHGKYQVGDGVWVNSPTEPPWWGKIVGFMPIIEDDKSRIVASVESQEEGAEAGPWRCEPDWLCDMEPNQEDWAYQEEDEGVPA